MSEESEVRAVGEREGELDPRIVPMVEAAMRVFARVGLRRTTMEEVAREAGMSRTALYRHFEDKEDLFRVAVDYRMETKSIAAFEKFAGGSTGGGLVRVLEHWLGAYDWSLPGRESDALMQTARRVAGEEFGRREKQLMQALALEVRDSELGARYWRVGVSGEQLVRALYAGARGLRESCETPDSFGLEMRVLMGLMWAVEPPG